MDRVNPERIALFGGTFDPVHHGHVEVLRSLMKSLLVDSIWVLPSPEPPHKRDVAPTSYNHRLQMIRLALKEYDLPVSICEVEQKLPKPSYTIQTVRFLQDDHPDCRFFLVIGADSLNQLHTWKSYKELLRRVPVIVARRPGWTNDSLDLRILERTLILDHAEVEISSRHLRPAIVTRSDSQKPKDLQIPDSVLKYIQQHNLYQDA